MAQVLCISCENVGLPKHLSHYCSASCFRAASHFSIAAFAHSSTSADGRHRVRDNAYEPRWTRPASVEGGTVTIPISLWDRFAGSKMAGDRATGTYTLEVTVWQAGFESLATRGRVAQAAAGGRILQRALQLLAPAALYSLSSPHTEHESEPASA